MNIRIESLSVNGLGPISSIKWQFKDINLIYGKNEKGKTYLVEFLLSTLFKSAKKTRPLTESGQVIVSGLDSKPIIFSPKTKHKLEEHIFTDDDKPIDLSRLCVVKGGELSFLTGGEIALSKSVLKEYLSDQRTLDVIDEGISATIKASRWENGIIVGGRNTGEIKKLNEGLQEIKQIDSLIEEVDQAYSLGEIKEFKKELTKVDQQLAEQDRARRAYAYELWKKIQEKDRELALIPSEVLGQAKDLINKIVSYDDLIKKNREEISSLEPKYKYYDWLKTAINECEKRPEAFAGRLIWPFVAMAIISTLATIVFAFLDLPFYSLGGGFLAILSLFLVILQYRSRLRNSEDRVEIENIFQEYEQKFGEKAKSIATLRNTEIDLTKTYGKLTNLREQDKLYNNKLSEFKKDLEFTLESLVGKKANLEDPFRDITHLEQKRNQLNNEREELRIQLAALNVAEEDYLEESIDKKFDQVRLKELKESKKELEIKIGNLEKTLESLKNKICSITHDPPTIAWDELVNNLRDKREDKVNEAKQLKAQIGSGILVFQTINEIRNREDERISKALASPGMCEPINALTHAYDGIEIDDNEIFAYNSIQRFPLSMLSTGAQEQVLLALRIGIASYVLKDKKMFLILDDAFQHSDWERREWLVDEMATLANIGWQIVYFSMDDHIKSLFENRLRPIFKDRYQIFELG